MNVQLGQSYRLNILHADELSGTEVEVVGIAADPDKQGQIGTIRCRIDGTREIALVNAVLEFDLWQFERVVLDPRGLQLPK